MIAGLPQFESPEPARVLILYNEPVLPEDHPDAESEHEILYTTDAVEKALVEAGHEVVRLGVQRDPARLLEGLREHQPDVVFNLFEGLADAYDTEAHVAGLLDWLGIPYTGCPYQTLSLARSKHLTKRLLQGAGVTTADFFVIDKLPVRHCPLDWPVIVKPATQDASVGLDQGSVVNSRKRLAERAAELFERYGGPVIVEEFIPGREFNVGVIEAPELLVLPASEILFTSKDPAAWPIVTYDAKWRPGTPDYDTTPPKYPAEISPRLAARLTRVSKQVFRLLGCRDYARVDFRVKPSGKAYVLEVNPNPDFSPMAGLAAALETAGWTYPRFAVHMVRQALARGRVAAGTPVAGVEV
jgi:D-alanine-D-alanine ligase